MQTAYKKTGRKERKRKEEKKKKNLDTMIQSLRSYGPEPGPRPSLQLEIPCGGWREHTGESLPTQCPIIHKGQFPPTKSSGIRCWRDTVLVLSAFDTVFPPLCVFDAPGWQERYGRPVRTSLGTSHGYPAATIPSS